MKVLVTGGSSFTARYLIPFLSAQGADVASLIQSLPPQENSHLSFIADLLDKNSLIAALEQFQPQAIIHLAGIALPSHPDVDMIYKVNMLGTKNLLEATLAANLNLKKFISASTSHVYGQVDGLPIPETHVPHPMSHYAISKLGMENIARLYFNEIPIIITRPFNYTGPGQSNQYVIANIVSKFKQQHSEITLGNTKVVRDFSYIDDIVNYYWQLINSDFESDIVNLCSGNGNSIDTIIQHLNQIAGYEIKVNSNNQLLRKQDNPIMIGNNQRLQKQIKNYTTTPLLQWLTKMYHEWNFTN